MRKFNFKEAVVQNAVQELHDCWHLLQISPFSCTVQHLFVFVCFFFFKKHHVRNLYDLHTSFIEGRPLPTTSI